MLLRKHQKPVSLRVWLAVQFGFGAAFAGSWFVLSPERQNEVVAKMSHTPVRLDVDLSKSTCAEVGPLYDDAEVVTDDELAMVLKKIVPRFSRSHLRPNLVEHALRTWGSEIQFNHEDAISGPQMAEFLTDTSKYIASWGQDNPPLLEETPQGIHVRWAEDSSASFITTTLWQH